MCSCFIEVNYAGCVGLIQALLLEAHEVEVKKLKVQEKLERQVAVDKEQVATQVQSVSFPWFEPGYDSQVKRDHHRLLSSGSSWVIISDLIFVHIFTGKHLQRTSRRAGWGRRWGGESRTKLHNGRSQRRTRRLDCTAGKENREAEEEGESRTSEGNETPSCF